MRRFINWLTFEPIDAERLAEAVGNLLRVHDMGRQASARMALRERLDRQARLDGSCQGLAFSLDFPTAG